MKHFYIIAIILLHTCNVFVSQAQQINIRSYSIEDGLVNNDVLNIYQDKEERNNLRKAHGFEKVGPPLTYLKQ